MLTTNALRTADGLPPGASSTTRREAASHGAVYLEGIFSPAERVRRGVTLGGDVRGVLRRRAGGARAARGRGAADARHHARLPARGGARRPSAGPRGYRDRGVVGVGLGGLEAEYPPEPYAPVFELARELGLPSVPHAGEVAGPASIRGALDALGADRASARDPRRRGPDARRRAARPRARARRLPDLERARPARSRSLEEHPLPQLVDGRGPLLDLDGRPGHVRHRPRRATTRLPSSLGVSPRSAYEAGVLGALCDDPTRAQLQAFGDAFDWAEAS